MTRTQRVIPAALENAANRWANRPFLVDGNSTVATYQQCLDEVERAAGALRELGLSRGDRVLIMAPNGPEVLWAWWGANILGAIAVVVNPAYKVGELAGILRHAEPVLAVVHADHVATLHAAVAETGTTPRVLVLGDSSDAASFARRRAQANPATPVNLDESDVAVLIYTSGTTGAPKAVMQTHRTYVLTSESFGWWVGLGDEERLWTCLPLHHVNAQAYSTMGALGGGHSLVLRPRFSASGFWDDLRACGATEFNAIGAILHILLKQPPRADDPDNPVRLCYAALALPQEQHRAFEQRFGLRMVVGYGLSESTFGTVWPKDQPPRYGSMGRPRQHPTLGTINHTRVVDEAGANVPPGQEGELWLQNPAIMAGYFRDPERTREVLVDGWLHTGDVVRADQDGWLTFVSRKADIIRRRGENISAAEIELCIAQSPLVQECAVIAVPSDLGEDEIMAIAVPAPGATVQPPDVTDWCAAHLAPFKMPRYILFRDTLPRTDTQRVAKHLLREEIARTGERGWDRLEGEHSPATATRQTGPAPPDRPA